MPFGVLGRSLVESKNLWTVAGYQSCLGVIRDLGGVLASQLALWGYLAVQDRSLVGFGESLRKPKGLWVSSGSPGVPLGPPGGLEGCLWIL